MSRWLITGLGGALAHSLVNVLSHREPHGPTGFTALTRSELDITDAEAVAAAVKDHDVVVNAAAWTRVDDAETDEAAATAVNGGGAANLAAACKASNATLLQVSTDYVFSGDAGDAPSTGWPEDAPTAPVNAYGRSKLAGEQAVSQILPERGYIVRTAWLYGPHGTNFVRTMLRLAATHKELRVVDDQRGQPTMTGFLAQQIVALGDAALNGTAPPGIYHGTAAGDTTWFGLTRALFEQVGLDPERVLPTTSADYPRPAKRPAFSVLGHERWTEAGIQIQQHWRTQLDVATSFGELAIDADRARDAAIADQPR
jgi:dTDP-4-dehydrorhamnose reductase